jgi:hypothetical protein
MRPSSSLTGKFSDRVLDRLSPIGPKRLGERLLKQFDALEDLVLERALRNSWKSL